LLHLLYALLHMQLDKNGGYGVFHDRNKTAKKKGGWSLPQLVPLHEYLPQLSPSTIKAGALERAKSRRSVVCVFETSFMCTSVF